MSFSAGRNLQNNINTTEAQTLSNKTLDNTNAIDGASVDNSTITNASIESPSRLDMKKDTLANLQTYAASATNGQLVYATDAKKTFQVVDAALVEVGSGDGSVNYIENSDFEQGIDGYTDDTNFTIAQTELAAEVLRGTASAKISKAAVDASGEEISIPFTVDRAGLASKITVSLEVDASDANYVDGDLRLVVRQDPNGTPSIIRLNGEDIKGGKGKVYAQFQSDATITEYELLIQCNSTNASAYDVIIDDVKVGPREVAFGTLITDWVPYTPTYVGLGTVSTSNMFYRRVGDTLHIRGSFITGTPTATLAEIGLPNNLKIDFSDASNTMLNGYIVRNVSNANTDFTPLMQSSNEDSLYIGILTGSGNFPTVPLNGNNAFGSSEFISVECRVPIQGWSSNAISSEDLGGREVVVEAEGNAGETLVGISAQNVPFIAIKDTTNSWNGTEFDCPETGVYDVSGSIRYTANVNTPAVQCFVDRGSGFTNERLFGIDQSGSARTLDFSGKISLNKGDKLAIRVEDPGTLENNTIAHNLMIVKIASPQAILETETVAARYTSSSGQSIPSGLTDLVYETLDSDTHNAYDTSTGIYTVPVSGYYNFSAKFNNGSNNLLSLRIVFVLDGTLIEDVQHVYATSDNFRSIEVNCSAKYLTKGQELKVQGACGSTSNMDLNDYRNTFSIARIK